jgi:hypothetical protein
MRLEKVLQKKQQQDQQKQQQQSKDGQSGEDEKNKDGQKQDESDDKNKSNQQKKFTQNKKWKPDFKSGKLSKEDADRVMSELSNREKQLQTKFKQQTRKNQAPGGKDW